MEGTGTRHLKSYSFLADVDAVNPHLRDYKFREAEKHSCVLNDVKRIYVFLNNGTQGKKEFMLYIRDKYKDCEVAYGDRTEWRLDPDEIMQEFYSIDYLANAIEYCGLYNYDDLKYWSSHVKYMSDFCCGEDVSL